MPIPHKTLRVHPNPYIHGGIDHLGRPAGRIPYDPQHKHAPKDIGVGAKLVDVVEVVPAQSYKVGKQTFTTAPARHDHRVSYSRVAVELPNTGYYRDAILTGVLLAADVNTYVAAGGAAKNFVQPAEALLQAREREIEHFNAATGENAHEEMGAFEPLWFGGDEEAPAAEAATPAPAAASRRSKISPISPSDTTTTDTQTTDASKGSSQ